MNDKKKHRLTRPTERAQVKQALREAFSAPAPLRKEEFFQDYPLPPISTFSLMVTQTGYIPKWTWLFSLGVFVSGLLYAGRMDPDTLWMLSALAPFIAMTLISENARSKYYSMTELEMSCRFFLKSILLARMGVLALSHLVLLCLLAPLVHLCSDYTILQAGVYLLVPYLLTVVLGLWATRKIPHRESLLACACIAGTISCLSILSKFCFSALWSTDYWNGWFVTLLLLLFFCAWEVRKTVKQMEDARWNFS